MEKTMKNDGGPAFPMQENESTVACEGMSLCDWFAGMAMQADISTRQRFMDTASKKECAKEAYEVACAMIAEREKSQDSS